MSTAQGDWVHHVLTEYERRPGRPVNARKPGNLGGGRYPAYDPLLARKTMFRDRACGRSDEPAGIRVKPMVAMKRVLRRLRWGLMAWIQHSDRLYFA